MAALLVGMSVAAVLMSALLPTWKTMARREKEAELVFRGEQYIRAIGQFQRRNGPGVLPPNLDVLVSQKFLRKKYKDPITGQDFDVLLPNTAAAQQSGQPSGGRGSAPQGRGTPVLPAQAGLVGAPATVGSGGRGGVMGVASKSKDTSLRIYNGRTKYNEWQFVYTEQAQAAGQGRGGPQPPNAGGPGGRGRQGGPGAPGAPFGPAGRGGAPYPSGGRGPSPGPEPAGPSFPRPQR